MQQKYAQQQISLRQTLTLSASNSATLECMRGLSTAELVVRLFSRKSAPLLTFMGTQTQETIVIPAIDDKQILAQPLQLWNLTRRPPNNVPVIVGTYEFYLLLLKCRINIVVATLPRATCSRISSLVPTSTFRSSFMNSFGCHLCLPTCHHPPMPLQ